MGQMQSANPWHLAHGAPHGLGNLVAVVVAINMATLLCYQVPKPQIPWGQLELGYVLFPPVQLGCGKVMPPTGLGWGNIKPPSLTEESSQAPFPPCRVRLGLGHAHFPYTAGLGPGHVPCPHRAGLGTSCHLPPSVWPDGARLDLVPGGNHHPDPAQGKTGHCPSSPHRAKR